MRPLKIISIPSKPFTQEIKHHEILSDYIKAALYDKKKGYFTNPQNIQLGQLSSPIKFGNLLGYNDYIEQLNANYPKYKFLTPSETFRPFYGMTMANYVRQQQLKNKIDTIRVVEIGSGLGGQADSFLTYFKNYEPGIYPYVEYTLLEISPTLLKKSYELLYHNHKDKCNRGDIKFINQDAFDFDEKLGSDVYFMLFEILDNLPHDMVKFTLALEDLEEMWIDSNSDRSQRKMVYQKSNDEYILQCFDIWKEMYFKNGVLRLKEEETPRNFLQGIVENFQKRMITNYQLCLPTGLYRLVENINKRFESPKFLLSDFSSLPRSNKFRNRSAYLNFPLLSVKLEKSEEHHDYENFEQAEFGKCDIFFETDFDLAKNIVERFSGKYTVSTPKDFFNQFAKHKWGETRSGYNPMKEDFANTRFLHQ